MTNAHDEAERNAILDRARRTLERLSNLPIERHDPLAEDALERWERGRPTAAPAHRQHEPSTREIEALRARDWTRWITGHLKNERAFNREVVARVVAHERRAFGDQIKGLKMQIDALAGEVAKLKECSGPPINGYGVVGDHGGNIIDIPGSFVRSSADAP